LEEGLRPEIAILKEVPRDDWEQHEIEAIQSYREAGADLFNVHLGGNEPPTYTDEIRERISESVKAVWDDPEYIAIQRSHDEHRSERSREAVIEHWADPETKERHIEGIRRGWDNEERRQKLSERNREREKDPEYRKKHRKAVMQSRTLEVCAKISAAKKAFYADPEKRREQSERMKARWADPEWRAAKLEKHRTRRLEVQVHHHS